MASKLGQLLVSSQVITDDQLNESLRLQKREGGRLGKKVGKGVYEY